MAANKKRGCISAQPCGAADKVAMVTAWLRWQEGGGCWICEAGCVVGGEGGRRREISRSDEVATAVGRRHWLPLGLGFGGYGVGREGGDEHCF